MVDFYDLLGVSADATPEQIKKAFQKAAFKHHPDVNPDSSKESQQHFKVITEAYQVLRDKQKRAQYDLMRGAGLGSQEGYQGGAGAGRSPFPGADFDRAFDEWWKRMSEEFREHAEERAEQERTTAERLARAAAWEREKEEAKVNKVRAERLRQRTEDARHLRHAKILRRFWQTHGGLTLYDAAFISLFTLGVLGLGYSWRQHLAARPAPAREAAPAPAAAAAATCAAPSPG